jgi:hypothetical protein
VSDHSLLLGLGLTFKIDQPHVALAPEPAKVISLKRFTLDEYRCADDHLLGTRSIGHESNDLLPDDLAGFRVAAAERCKSP